MKYRELCGHSAKVAVGPISAGNILAKSIATVTLLCASLVASAASFDCAKAATFVE